MTKDVIELRAVVITEEHRVMSEFEALDLREQIPRHSR